MDKILKDKKERLDKIVTEAGSAVVAFSGGVDSTFLLKVCVDLLGEKALAITARSDSFPQRELNEAQALAALIGGRHMIIDSEELDVPGFSDNPPHRCFLCKSELFSKLKEAAQENGLAFVFDGSNLDDTGDYRPGRDAARQLGVRSPLIEAGLRKQDIRELSKGLDLPTWDKPSFACLSSRFPYYTPITRTALHQIEQAEDFLWNLGLREFRVRHHDTMARLELGKKELDRFWESGLKDEVVRFVKSLGYNYVTLDLEGYRTGSMNETLTEQDKKAAVQSGGD
jgi:uncharacterized protein